jgi:hypothetical protein
MIIKYVTPEGSVSSGDSYDPDLLIFTPEATFQPDPIASETSFDPDDIRDIPEAYYVEMLESEERLRQLQQQIDMLTTQLRNLESQLRAAE